MARHRLNQLLLEKVGPFERTEFIFPERQNEELANIHLLTGPNGCGKSTVLYAIAQIFQGHGVGDIMRSRFRAANSRVAFVYGGKLGQYHVGSMPAMPAPVSQQVKIQGAHGSIFYQPDTLKENETVPSQFPAFAYSGHRSFDSPPLRAIEPLKISPFADALSFEKSIRPGVLLQWVANNRTQWALAKAEGDEAAAELYNKAIRRISDFITSVCGFEVEFKLERAPINVVFLLNGAPVPLNVLPDGLKSILGWIGDLILRLDTLKWKSADADTMARPIYLLLDELDVHLHPKWQRLILPAIQKLVPNAEVFASTHSPFVVGSVDDAWVYRLPEPAPFRDSPDVEMTTIRPEPSSGGKSYSVILKEVFSVEDQFDPETEELFDRFYVLRDTALTGDEDVVAAFRSVGEELSSRGEEPAAIVAREIRQFERRRGRDVA